MKKIIIPVVVAVLILLFISYAYTSIKKLPYDKFESLQELKNSISSDLGIRFPETTGYEFEKDAIYQKNYVGKSNTVMGYSYGGELDTSDSHTDLRKINFGCTKLAAVYDERNPVPPLDANTKILVIDVYEQIQDESEDSNLSKLGWYPEDSKIVNYYYQFDLEGCRYYISGTLVIPPDELNTLNTQEVETMVEDGKNEVLDLVMSIIDKQNS